MLLPLLVQNLRSTGTGDVDFTVVEIVRDYRLEGAAIVIDGVLAGFTRSIGVFRLSGISSGPVHQPIFDAIPISLRRLAVNALWTEIRTDQPVRANAY